MSKLSEMHSLLRRYRYFYYEKNVSLVTDYEYDIMEKEYDKMCTLHNVPKSSRISSFVGFSINIPMQLKVLT